MDIQMPVMNGYDAARSIRALSGEYYAKLPIIAMSANAYEDDVRECLEAGMNAHIAKPFNPDELLIILHNHIIVHDD
jgi:CheY-like chemotaxis protein